MVHTCKSNASRLTKQLFFATITGMNEVNTLPRFEAVTLNQEQADVAFAGIVASMNTVQLDLNSIKTPDLAVQKDDKFNTQPLDVAANSSDAVKGGMSFEEMQALKADANTKFDRPMQAQSQFDEQRERLMVDILDAEQNKRDGKKKNDSYWNLAA